MPERPLRIVLDDHVVDRLETDLELRQPLEGLIFDGSIVVLMPHVYQSELQARAGGMPGWLPIRVIPDATSADVDVLVSDDTARRKRAELSAGLEGLAYDEFAELLKLLRLKNQAG